MANQVELSKGTEYEFGQAENQIMKGLSGSLMILVASWSLLGGAYIAIALRLLVGAGKVSGITIAVPIIAGLIALGVAGFFFQTRAAVEEAVNTEGYDITNAMRAMKKLRTLHTVQGVWFITVAVLVAVVFALSLSG